MLQSSLSLIGGRVITMGLGFFFWLLAARLFTPSDVGLAVGAISAVMLTTQLALLGLGSSVVAYFPRYERAPAALLNTALTLVVACSFVTGAVFLVAAGGVFDELDVVATEPLFAVSFIAMSVLGTAGLLFDQVSTAVRRGDQVLFRAVLFGIINLTLLGGLAAAAIGSAAAIFSTWVGGSVVACVYALVQLRRSPARYAYRPGGDRSLARGLVGVGLPNHALTLAERAPGLVLPIVVTELISPAANAAWYMAWMMAFVLYIIPIQVGMTTFAEAAHEPDALRGLIRRGLRSSLALGVAGIFVVAATGPYVLRILGDAYAAQGSTPLRILVLAVIPMAFLQSYFVHCRSLGRFREATGTGVVVGAVSVAAAVLVAPSAGLEGIAIAWLAAQSLGAGWAAWRLWGPRVSRPATVGSFSSSS